jgi:hypothetical protein
MAGNGTGGGRVAWWIVGLLSTLLLFAATTFAVHVETTLAEFTALAASRGERVTALERDVAALYMRVARLEGAAGAGAR